MSIHLGSEQMSVTEDAREKEREYWLNKGQVYLAGVSDRLRAMSLGSLVLIWGVLAGESKNLVLSKGMKVTLLCVGIGATLVLLLDYLEYSLGYKESRVKAGFQTAPKWDLEQMKENTLSVKQIIGAVSLFTLIVSLAVFLFTSVVHGAQPGVTDFVGRWCGTRVEGTGNAYMLIDVSSNYGEPQVLLDGTIACTRPLAVNGELRFSCGNIQIFAKRMNNKLSGVWQRGKDPNSPRGSFTVVRCDHH